MVIYAIIKNNLENEMKRQDEELKKYCNVEEPCYVFKTSDKSELVEKLKDLDANDDNYCIEIYEANENLEIIEGSDYDSISNFLINIERR